jgi:hypothetical protein
MFVCGAWFRFGGVTMCKTHLDKTLHPAPFLSSSARSLSAFGVRHAVGPYRVLLRLAPLLGSMSHFYRPGTDWRSESCRR